jgi:hypothetical protein
LSVEIYVGTVLSIDNHIIFRVQGSDSAEIYSDAEFKSYMENEGGQNICFSLQFACKLPNIVIHKKKSLVIDFTYHILYSNVLIQINKYKMIAKSKLGISVIKSENIDFLRRKYRY